MSPNRRQLLTARAGGALSLTAVPATRATRSPEPLDQVVCLRGRVGMVEYTTLTTRFAHIDFRIASNKISFQVRRPHDRENIDHIETTDSAVVAFMAQVVQHFDQSSVLCELCGDTGTVRHPFTGEHDPCALCR